MMLYPSVTGYLRLLVRALLDLLGAVFERLVKAVVQRASGRPW